MKISDIIRVDISQVLKVTGYDTRPDRQEIVDYYGLNFQKCFALKLYDVTEFEKHLTLSDMRKINSSIHNIILIFMKIVRYIK